MFLIPIVFAGFFYVGDAEGLNKYPEVVNKVDYYMGHTVPDALNGVLFKNRFVYEAD